jgi:outer membrane protein assembly factor BamB
MVPASAVRYGRPVMIHGGGGRVRLRLRYGVSILAAVLVAAPLVGCDNKPAAKSPAAKSPGSNPPAAQPAKLKGPVGGVDPSPVLRSDEGTPLLTDDWLIEARSLGDGTCRLTARALADPTKPRWTYAEPPGRDLYCHRPVLVASTIVMSYGKETPAQGVQPKRVEYGVVGFDLSGKQSWRTEAAGINVVAGATERYVVATYDKHYERGTTDEDRQRQPAVVAVEAATGKVLWRAADLFAVGVDSETVLAVRETRSGPQIGAKTLFGLDIATGQQRWTGPWSGSAGRTYTASEDGAPVAFVGGGVMVLDTSRGYGAAHSASFRDVRTGAELFEEVPSGQSHKCVSDATTVVCAPSSNFDQHVFAYDLTARKRLWTLPTDQVNQTDTKLRCVVSGRLFVSTSTGGAILDATTGKQLAANLAAAPEQVKGAYGIAPNGQGYDLYRLTEG